MGIGVFVSVIDGANIRVCLSVYIVCGMGVCLSIYIIFDMGIFLCNSLPQLFHPPPQPHPPPPPHCPLPQGLFYNRFPSPKQGTDLGTETDINLNQQLWYHVVGTEQSHDVKVLELPGNPDWMIGAEVTDDGR